MSIPFKARPLRGSEFRRAGGGGSGSGAAASGEVAQLREYAGNLAATLQSVVREMAVLRQEHEAARATVAQFAAQLEPALQPLRRANEALVVAAEVIEQQRIREIEDREELRRLLQVEREARDRQAEAYREQQPRLGRQLAAIESGDSRIVAGVEARTHELADALEQWQGALRHQFEGIREDLRETAAHDQEATRRLSQAGEQIRTVQEEVSRQLLGLNRTLEDINRAARATLAEEEARASQACREEAVRLNRLGLQHLARGNPEAAVARFHEAGAQDPAALEPRLNLAVALLHCGRAGAAAQLADELAGAFPARPEARWVRGVARLALGDVDSARVDLAGVPANPGAGEELSAAAGLAHLLGGDGRAALQALAAAARSRSHEGDMLRGAGFQPEFHDGSP
jgi:hypothetical protein